MGVVGSVLSVAYLAGLCWSEILRLYRFHDMRVFFCTNLVAAGVQAPVLMDRAGRSQSLILPGQSRRISNTQSPNT
jgi:hypothetical protein